jgi:hypothetical protein
VMREKRDQPNPHSRDDRRTNAVVET